MWQWLKSVMWDNRNEPLLVAIGVGVLAILVCTWAVQVYRQAPLKCGDTILPVDKNDCPVPPSVEPFPVGTIVAYFGSDNRIPTGWVLCDGQPAPENSVLDLDANGSIEGNQLPDLRGRFIRGSFDPLQPGNLVVGGSDTTDLSHAHRWASFESDEWYSYIDRNNDFGKVDNWDDGIHNHGEGDYPLLIDNGRSLYTERVGNTNESNLPSYAELRFIIRVF